MSIAFDFDQQGHLIAPRPAVPKLTALEPSATPAQAAKRSVAAPLPAPLVPQPRPADLTLDRSRDNLLTAFGKATLTDRYLLAGESYQDMFARVACAFADDVAHAQRLYDAMSRLWFMPATPILSNGGAARGLPISCFLNSVPGSLDGIVATWNENVWLASNGGGIGTYWGRVRSIGEKVKGGETSGIIPFIHAMDGLTLVISQGSLRRGSAAVYLDIHHPKIEESLEIRKASGDFNRKGLNLHHGVNITDAFMEAVKAGAMFPLRSPKYGEIVREVDTRQLWQRILETRLQTGEPYLLFIDAVNRALPKHQRELGLTVSTSNLCSEITLPTGIDHRDEERTAVCCLSSLNAETWDDWRDAPGFIKDVMRFLDNVLTHPITVAPDGMKRALRSAARTLGRARHHGLPLVPASPGHSVRKRAGEVVEPEDVPQDPARCGCRLGGAGEGARALSGCRRTRDYGALFPQARRPTSTPTKRCRAPSRCAIRISRSCWRARTQTLARSGSRSSSTKARSRISICSVNTRRRCSAPRSRSISAGGGGARGGPCALYLPEPVDQPLPPGRRR